MKHASLFSGIGGFDLAAEWMNWENVFNCEIDDWCQMLLKQNFPNSNQYKDITKTCFKKYENTIDIITGGFPCQPYSVAGKRKGTADDRHLWPEMLRCIREIKPRFVVGENVGGLVSWNDGLVFEQVFLDLENEGYEVGAFILPACAVNAPHRRDRVWIIAHSDCKRRHNRVYNRKTRPNKTEQKQKELQEVQQKWSQFEFESRQIDSIQNKGELPKPGISRGDDGFPYRLDRTKGLGNAIVPKVAYEIFKKLNSL